MRAAHDAVMIGAETARRDDPSLLARTSPEPLKQPARIVVTSRFDVPFDGKLFASVEQSPVFVFGVRRMSPARHAILEGAGACVEHAPATAGGVQIGAVLSRLEELGLANVLAEGGGRLAASLISANLVDRIEWFRAPLVLGMEGRPAVAALELARLADAPRFRRVALRELGPDIWESYERAS